ncbi:MAG: hypothetical protein ACFCVF_03880 [Kineosporiaceae bacterium]
MKLLTRARMIPAAVVLAGAATLLMPGSPALAYISPPLVLLAEPESPARLVAQGAAVDVTVEYSCAADFMGIGLSVRERVGRAVASGSGGVSVPCDGRTHRTVIRVPADGGGPAFTRGSAAVETFVDGCRTGDDGLAVCAVDRTFDTIRIRR